MITRPWRRQAGSAACVEFSFGALAAAILLVAPACGLSGQSDAHPAFQSVSIKRNTSNWSERFQHPMGMSMNASLMLLIQFAYAPHDNPMRGHSLNLPSSQVVGGPAWINSEGYDIEVKPEGQHRSEAGWLMWQTLLADRFKLRLHRETRELPVYDLTCREEWPQIAGGETSGLRFFSARHAAATRTGEGRLWLCLGTILRVRGRATAHKREQGPHSGPDKRAYIGTGPADLG